MAISLQPLQRGFTVVEVLIAVAVIVLLGLLGWRAWEAYTADQAREDSTLQTVAQDVPAIQSQSDLDTVDKMLDGTNVEGEFENELETETRF